MSIAVYRSGICETQKLFAARVQSGIF